ncbi:uncharacterized protein [Panulirus ornatus]|uniref:uncharacterized protein n=1 Tax=Panulirus ornatus TaxID=150431 RepID=UPI003A8A8A32
MSEEAESLQEGSLPLEDVVPRCRVAAVVPAAGCGKRMAHSTPKQYLTVSGQPLVVHCLRALQETPWVQRVVVVAEDLTRMQGVVTQAHLSKVTVVQGGRSRHRSISVGVEALAQDPPDVVLVHDGVRPLLPPDILAQVVVWAERCGAAGAVRPLISTVLRPDHQGLLQKSLVRSDYRNSEMPQAFRYAVLRDAYRRCSEAELDHGTECLALALHYAGVRAKLVLGPPHLWKVTEERDLVVARALLPRYIRRIAVICRALSSSSSSQEVRPLQRVEGVVEGSSHNSSQVASDEDIKSCHLLGSHVPTPPVEGQKGLYFRKTTADPHARRVPLTCDSECVLVFTALESTLRTSSRNVYLSSDSDITSTAPGSCVMVIANLDTVMVFQECLQEVARGIDHSVCTVILIFTLKSEDCDVTVAHLTLLQHQLRDVFSKHSANVTVLLRSSSRTSLMQSSCQGEKYNSYTEKSPTSVSPSPASGSTGDENCRLGDLVQTLLDQTTGCFHGQVLVL